jgi:hypothetical protein
MKGQKENLTYFNYSRKICRGMNFVVNRERPLVNIEFEMDSTV